IGVHHLGSDGVSWRILVPDLVAAVASAAAGEPVALEPVGTSFRSWSALLGVEALSEDRLCELELWRGMLAGGDPLLGQRALEPSLDTPDTLRHLGASLPAEVTAPLLGAVPAAFHGGVNDVLLCAFALAVAEWRRRRGRGASPRVLVDVEGHGREEIAPGVDLTRTLGWFTSLYPVALEPGALAFEEVASGAVSLGRAVKAVKEQLAALPDHGLEVNSMVRDHPDGPRLEASWSWAGELLAEDEVAELARLWFAALQGLVVHAARPGAGGHSPSDFALARIGQADIDELEARGELAEVWALTPMQEGLAFQTRYGQGGTDVYTVQLVLELAGRLDASRLRRGLQALLERHPNLKAAFVQVASGATVSVVARDVRPALAEVDLSSLAEAEALAEAARLAEEDHAAGFELSQAPLLRFSLMRLGPERHRLVITNHHILMDGWSMPVLLVELAALYESGGDDE